MWKIQNSNWIDISKNCAIVTIEYVHTVIQFDENEKIARKGKKIKRNLWSLKSKGNLTLQQSTESSSNSWRKTIHIFFSHGRATSRILNTQTPEKGSRPRTRNPSVTTQKDTGQVERWRNAGSQRGIPRPDSHVTWGIIYASISSHGTRARGRKERERRPIQQVVDASLTTSRITRGSMSMENTFSTNTFLNRSTILSGADALLPFHDLWGWKFGKEFEGFAFFIVSSFLRNLLNFFVFLY